MMVQNGGASGEVLGRSEAAKKVNAMGVVKNTETEVARGDAGVVEKTETGVERGSLLRKIGGAVLQQQEARKLTEEIDQATNRAAEMRDQAVGMKHEGRRGGAMMEDARGGAGWEEVGAGRAETGAGWTETGVGEMDWAEQVDTARRELRQDERELVHPLESVGQETKLLDEERLEADLEDLRNEENLPPEGASETEKKLIEFQHNVVKKTDTEITAAVKAKAEALMEQPVFNPADLEKLRFQAMVEDLSGADAYKFGQGNMAA